MLQNLGLEVAPPVPLNAIFDDDFLRRLTEPAPRPQERSLPAPKAKKKQSSLTGLEASALQAKLLEEIRVKQEQQPKPVRALGKRQFQRKYQKAKVRHAKAPVARLAEPTPRPKLTVPENALPEPIRQRLFNLQQELDGMNRPAAEAGIAEAYSICRLAAYEAIRNPRKVRFDDCETHMLEMLELNDLADRDRTVVFMELPLVNPLSTLATLVGSMVILFSATPR